MARAPPEDVHLPGDGRNCPAPHLLPPQPHPGLPQSQRLEVTAAALCLLLADGWADARSPPHLTPQPRYDSERQGACLGDRISGLQGPGHPSGSLQSSSSSLQLEVSGWPGPRCPRCPLCVFQSVSHKHAHASTWNVERLTLLGAAETSLPGKLHLHLRENIRPGVPAPLGLHPVSADLNAVISPRARPLRTQPGPLEPVRGDNVGGS